MKLALTALVALTIAMPVAAKPAAPNGEQELIAMEAAWAHALVAHDAAALSHIVAPDWHGQNQSGKWTDRAAMMKNMTSGVDKFSAMTNHDMHVRFVGADLGFVQGMDTETSTHNGKSSSGTYGWTDIYQKRDGHWVAIASQNTPITPTK